METFFNELYINIYDNIDKYKSHEYFSNMINSKIVKYYLEKDFSIDQSFTFAIILHLFMYYNI